MSTNNMNYYFNVEYFEGINFKLNSENKDDVKKREKLIADNNKKITEFQFNAVSPLNACKNMKGYETVEVYTVYPGLLVGTGYPHDVAIKGAIKQGFSFDYVTGLPYIPGSSLKGMLRAYFPDDRKDAEKNAEFTELIRGILNKPDLDAKKFKENIFENNDIFLGAYPMSGKESKLMEMEYITSHKEKFKNPNPISLVKIRPGIKFQFAFILSDYVENGNILVSHSEKKTLFEELIILMGIGAKTNTGFGRFTKGKPTENVVVSTVKPQEVKKCITPGCKGVVTFNPTKNKICDECYKKSKVKKNAQRV